ncbi:uncharacterized protein LOC126379383 isoform X2 [Pectinophora gossypiella]|uniref:uncharacterized protein LOC126379383 isoform X2 n=1 Tax=Pectinophora gossypiella TaxID=13191 RepID=UPI00214F0667|nr:uncharacterized protein LOC126379383 isoform X2 [Pectinophora gossypiella]
MAALRTKIVLVLINIICAYCDTVDEIKTDILLRGSGEQFDLEEAEVPLKDIEPEKTLREELKNVDLNREVELSTTTDNAPTTTLLEEVDKDDDIATTVLPTDTTVIDNTVDITDNYDNTSSIDLKLETTSAAWSSTTTTTPTPTTRGIDDMEAVGSGVAAFDDEHDYSPRVPKLSDNLPFFPAEPKQQDTRNFDVKPITPPSVSKSSTLKGWLEDSWLRPPAGILVPLRPIALSRALAVWNDLAAEGLNVTDIVIVGYDSNGVNWRSRHNLQPSSNAAGQRTVSEALSKLLLKYQDVNAESNSDATMKALTSAAKLVPYDSALFIITDRGAVDNQRLPLALRALVEKRLKVYTIWTDPAHPAEESERQLQGLRNVSTHTEGDVLPYSLQVMDMENAANTESGLQQWSPDLLQSRRGRVHHNMMEHEKLDTLLVRRGGGEAISLGVPVENGVTALRIYIEGLVEHAVLYPPNDAPQIDLYNETSVASFSAKSTTDGLSPRDVYLAFPGIESESDVLTVLPMKPTASDASAPTVGVWHLSVRCDTCDYRLCVAARAHIHFTAQIEPKEMLKIRVIGPVASVRETVLIDEYGTELAALPFSYQPIVSDGQNMPLESPPAELVASVNLPSVKGSRVYAKIVGRDVKGEPFVRLSGPLNQQEVRMGRSASASIGFADFINDLEIIEDISSKVYNEKLQYNESTVLPFNRAISQVVNQRGSLLTAVQIGLGTRLYGAPGDSLQLHFEVTNFRDQSVLFVFQAVGELRFLRGISPTRQWINSGQTANVIVNVGITANAQPGARDLITFTATPQGFEPVSISAYVYVINSGQSQVDVWAPELRHNFQGSCIGRLGDDCAQHAWSATVIARDTVGGLLRLSSSPVGVLYDSNFVAGSREEVVAVYRATCCAPRVVVTAVDAHGNANSYLIDISSYLSEAAIASIVLGVFLLIAIIALIVFLIYWCVKRRRESRELPYTTSTSRNLS